MVKNYKVVTLCGSTRFKKEFLEAQKRLTLEGNIVISVGLFGHSGDSEVWENMDEGTLTETKSMLDDMHKRKIDMADEIYVINVGGYIGDSTRSEIEYAKENGKDVRYLEETDAEEIERLLTNLADGKDYRTGEHLDIENLENSDSIKQTIADLYNRYCIKQVENKTEKAAIVSKPQDYPYAQKDSVASMIESAEKLKEKGDTREAIRMFTKALESGPSLERRAAIIGEIILCNIRIGHRNRANQFYSSMCEKYGDPVDADYLIKIAKELFRVGDPNNARKYAVEAYNHSSGDVDPSLLELIKQLWPEKGNQVAGARQPKDDGHRAIKKSCDNCKLYRNENCAGLRGMCEDYIYAPTTSEEELENWPDRWGPYASGFIERRKKGMG